MEKNKNNLLYYVVVGILVLVIIVSSVLFICNLDVFKKDDNIDVIDKVDENVEQDGEDEQLIIYNSDEVLSMITGIWKYVDETGTKYAMRVFVNEVGENRFSVGEYGTDGGIYGKITDILHINDSFYQLVVFSPGCHDEYCLYESEDETYYISVNLLDIDNKILGVGVNDIVEPYEFVGYTWEEVESSFSY